MPPLIVIAGPTATGKTALAIDLVARLPGAEIISADSRQVYRGLDIATAKPTPAELATAPHHCLDLVDPDEPFTASHYQHAALEALAGIAARGRVALLVGGTGLYLRAIAWGLPLDRGDSDALVRETLQARLLQSGLTTLLAELQERDPIAAATIDLHNPRRVTRALERAIVSGSALPPAPRGYPGPIIWLGLRRDPGEHRRAIAARIDAQFEAGLLDEAGHLRERYDEGLAAFSAMGYREAFAVLAGDIDLAEAKARDARRTWAYARRQRTWFRSEPELHAVPAGEGATAAALALLAPFLRDIERESMLGSDEP